MQCVCEHHAKLHYCHLTLFLSAYSYTITSALFARHATLSPVRCNKHFIPLYLTLCYMYSILATLSSLFLFNFPFAKYFPATHSVHFFYLPSHSTKALSNFPSYFSMFRASIFPSALCEFIQWISSDAHSNGLLRVTQVSHGHIHH